MNQRRELLIAGVPSSPLEEPLLLVTTAACETDPDATLADFDALAEHHADAIICGISFHLRDQLDFQLARLVIVLSGRAPSLR